MARICLHDPAVIGDYLQQNTALNLYKLGDLDAFFWPHTQWYGWCVAGCIEAVALLYTGDRIPVLLLMEDTAAARQLLHSLVPLLPRRFYAHLRPGQESVLPFVGQGGDVYLRMVQHQAKPVDFQGFLEDYPEISARVLSPQDRQPLDAFYACHYPQNWFNARMLETGAYVALETRDGDLRAVAGIHVLSRPHQLAALGNIAVHQDFRGKGLGLWITAFLSDHLRQHFGIQTLGLNVHIQNQKAQSCYERLGFCGVATYQEWTFE